MYKDSHFFDTPNIKKDSPCIVAKNQRRADRAGLADVCAGGLISERIVLA